MNLKNIVVRILCALVFMVSMARGIAYFSWNNLLPGLLFTVGIPLIAAGFFLLTFYIDSQDEPPESRQDSALKSRGKGVDIDDLK